jgi:transcriptional regulator
MYILEAFKNSDESSALSFIEKNNFADVVTNFNNQLRSNKVPLFLDREDKVLLGHIGRANPQLEHFENSIEALVIFSGPHAYISPQWYLSQNMVPTWNFQTAQVRGKADIVNENKLMEILLKLSSFHESQFIDQWSPDSLDIKVKESMLKMIVGFQIKIDDIKFKEKLSQNRSMEDRKSVIASLFNQPDSTSKKVAKLMRDKLEL